MVLQPPNNQSVRIVHCGTVEAGRTPPSPPPHPSVPPAAHRGVTPAEEEQIEMGKILSSRGMGMDNYSDWDSDPDGRASTSHGDSDFCEVLQIPASWANRRIKIEPESIVCSIITSPPTWQRHLPNEQE